VGGSSREDDQIFTQARVFSHKKSFILQYCCYKQLEAALLRRGSSGKQMLTPFAKIDQARLHLA